MNALTLEQEALKLSPLARARLVDKLQASLEDDISHSWDEAAFNIANARCEAMDRGETIGIPAKEAIEQARISLLKRCSR